MGVAEAGAAFVLGELVAGPGDLLGLVAVPDGQIGSPQLELWLGDGGAELLGGADVVGTALLLGAVLLGAVLVWVGVAEALEVVGVADGCDCPTCWVVGIGATGLPSR